MTMNGDLGEALERFVTGMVDCGLYESRSEVLREGVRLLQERETRLAELDAALARGIAEADAGRLTPADEVFDRIEAKLLAKAKAR